MVAMHRRVIFQPIELAQWQQQFDVNITPGVIRRRAAQQLFKPGFQFLFHLRLSASVDALSKPAYPPDLNQKFLHCLCRNWHNAPCPASQQADGAALLCDERNPVSPFTGGSF